MGYPTTAAEITLTRLNLELDVLMAQNRLDNFNTAFPADKTATTEKTTKTPTKPKEQKAETAKTEKPAETPKLDYAKDVQPKVIEAAGKLTASGFKAVDFLKEKLQERFGEGIDHAKKVPEDKWADLVAFVGELAASAKPESVA